jgi:hypothetical protein
MRSGATPFSAAFPPKFVALSGPACLGPGGNAENSPAFQRLSEKGVEIRPGGTAERRFKGSKNVPESGNRQFWFPVFRD